jgi:hypothetical protein
MTMLAVLMAVGQSFPHSESGVSMDYLFALGTSQRMIS